MDDASLRWVESHSFSKPLSILISLSLLLVVIFYHRRSAPSSPSNSIPWVGLRDEWFRISRAHLRDANKGKEYLKEGYEKYSKHGKAFISPVLARKELIVLPFSSIPWLLRQPEDRISQPKVMAQLVQSRYFLPALPNDEVIHPALIKVDLNRHLSLLTSAIVDEIRGGLAEQWGADTENWRSVKVMDTIKSISTRIAARVFFGADLTHDASFFAHTDAFSFLLASSSGILAFFVPAPLRPLLGPVFALPTRYYVWRMNRKLIPLIEHRIAQISSSPLQGEEDRAPSAPAQDLLTHHITTALASANPADRSPATIAARLQVILGFAAIPTTYLTTTNILLNLASTPSSESSASPSPDTLLTLRAEAQRVLAANGGVWTRTSLLSLVHADSFVKETMRLYPFSGRGLLHEVVAEEGIVLPAGVGPGDETVVASKGTWLSAPIGEIQRDEDIYGKDAEEFEAWRFVAGGMTEEGEEEEVSGKGSGKGSSVVTTSDTFLSFSRGKHVCPGRFFAANVMKLLLAHVAMEYDIKPLEKRPENVLFSDISAPSDKAEIEVRRRKQDE